MPHDSGASGSPSGRKGHATVLAMWAAVVVAEQDTLQQARRRLEYAVPARLGPHLYARLHLVSSPLLSSRLIISFRILDGPVQSARARACVCCAAQAPSPWLDTMGHGAALFDSLGAHHTTSTGRLRPRPPPAEESSAAAVATAMCVESAAERSLACT